MAGKLLNVISTAEVALSAATAKTVLQVKTTAGTNLPTLLIKKIKVFFDGVSTVAEPVIIKLITQTTDGTGTSVTPVCVNGRTDTILCTGAYNFSAEPTTGEVKDLWEVHPQGGVMETLPLNAEYYIGANQRWGLVVTAPAIVNCSAVIQVEE